MALCSIFVLLSLTGNDCIDEDDEHGVEVDKPGCDCNGGEIDDEEDCVDINRDRF